MVRNKRDKSLHLDHLLPLDHSPEHCVFPVQPWCGHGGEEELRAVGVHTRIGHGQSEGLVTQSAGTRVQGSGFQGLGFQGFFIGSNGHTKVEDIARGDFCNMRVVRYWPEEI